MLEAVTLALLENKSEISLSTLSKSSTLVDLKELRVSANAKVMNRANGDLVTVAKDMSRSASVQPRTSIT